MTGIDISKAVRRVAPSDYGLGYQAPETTQSQATPAAASGDGAVTSADPGHGHRDFAEPGKVTSAKRGSPNDFGWSIQDRAQFSGYRETCLQVAAAAGATLTLHPDHVSIFEITAAGSLTIAFGDFAPIDPPNPRALLLPFAASLVVMVHRQAGSTIAWPTNLRWEASVTNAIQSPPAAARDDLFVFVSLPGSGWLGHVISQGYA